MLKDNEYVFNGVYYFTEDRVNTINKRLREELNLKYLPYLGANVIYGKGEMCLEENNGVFKYYVIDRNNKVYLEIYDNVYDAVDSLVKHYSYCFKEVNESMMKSIIYEVLGLKTNRKAIIR